MIKRISTVLILLTLLCCLTVTVHAETNTTVKEAVEILLEYHGVETEMDVSSYLTLDAEEMTREAAVTAVVRSFGVYPADEADYVWADEDEQDEAYRPYIDYAKRMGITVGVGDGCFAPKQSVTEWELRTMLDRADGIEPEYPLSYQSPICKLLSADIQRGLSLVPDYLVSSYYADGRTITATTNPIVRDDGIVLSDQYAGWIWYDGDMFVAVTYNGIPYSCQYVTVIHELGHYLGCRTSLLNRNTVPRELDWMMDYYRDYCNKSDHEFMAESFVAYILWPDEMAANAPTVYRHIETCLHEMKSDLEETNYE